MTRVTMEEVRAKLARSNSTRRYHGPPERSPYYEGYLVTSYLINDPTKGLVLVQSPHDYEGDGEEVIPSQFDVILGSDEAAYYRFSAHPVAVEAAVYLLDNDIPHEIWTVNALEEPYDLVIRLTTVPDLVSFILHFGDHVSKRKWRYSRCSRWD